MALANVIERFAEKLGIDQTEVEELLADAPQAVDFDQPLPGQAADVLEVYLSEWGEGMEDSDGLLWYPMIRAGQHAMRPGPRGEKVRKPLKIVAGNSDDPLNEIGLKDLVDSFGDDAVDYVTIPTSHDNKVLENTGFIRGMRIADSPVQTGPDKGKKLPTLFGGYDFTEPDVKAKVKRGTIPGRSCGILYNYLNTETAKEYPAVVEHVALTPKPWIRGMLPFGRKLSEDSKPVAFSLSDDAPDEPDVEVQLAEGDATVTWTHEDSPNWLKQQVDEILRAARQEKRKTLSNNSRSSGSYVEDSVPYYRANEAKSESPTGGKALICDGYSDGSNYWVAAFKIEDGQVELDDFEQWQAVKSVYVADDRDPPDPGKEPLDEFESAKLKTPRDRLQLAQSARRNLIVPDGAQVPEGARKSNDVTHPRGGEQHMAEDNGTLQLSEEARRQIDETKAEAERLKDENVRLGEKVERLTETNKQKDAREFIEELKAMGFDEKHGFSGALVELQNIMLADDQEPALVSEKFSEDGTEVSLTVSDCFRRFFGAIKKSEEGKVALGEGLEQPSEETPEGEGGEPTGKPPAEETLDELSAEKAEERAQKLAEENPELAKVTGIKPVAKDERKAEEVSV